MSAVRQETLLTLLVASVVTIAFLGVAFAQGALVMLKSSAQGSWFGLPLSSWKGSLALVATLFLICVAAEFIIRDLIKP